MDGRTWKRWRTQPGSERWSSGSKRSSSSVTSRDELSYKTCSAITNGQLVVDWVCGRQHLTNWTHALTFDSGEPSGSRVTRDEGPGYRGDDEFWLGELEIPSPHDSR